MDIVIILSTLLVICMVAFIPVIMKRPKEVAELEKENGWLKEVIQNRDDTIDELHEELAIANMASGEVAD